MSRETDGQAKVAQPDIAVMVDHYILGLNVAVHDFALVAGLESTENLREDLVTLLLR